ncbi:MAG: hypothetical protein N3A66_07780, partial [Planctomycetota bacterium]|nr:hypothetical protein [Planctomycetota bacterium]
VRNQGPILLLDNVINGKGRPLVWHQPTAEQAYLISICNLYSCEKAVEVKGRVTQINESVGSADIKMREPVPFLPRQERPLLALKPAADAKAIQAAIDEASQHAGKR